MSLILAATGSAGFLASFVMLRLGLSAMWLRYALAVLLAYMVFLLLLRVWLLLHSREPLGDLPGDLLNLTPNVEAGARTSPAAAPAGVGTGGQAPACGPPPCTSTRAA